MPSSISQESVGHTTPSHGPTQVPFTQLPPLGQVTSRQAATVQRPEVEQT